MFMYFMLRTSLKMKFSEGSGRISSTCSGWFRNKDLGDGKSMVVTAGPKVVNKVG